MKSVRVYHYEAFSLLPNKGNPAGVVLDTDDLNAADMQAIAHEVGFNETVFVSRSEKADVKLTYYTPRHEMDLCGHATVASLYAMKTRGLLGDVSEIRIETNAGILPIRFTSAGGSNLLIQMKQSQPQFVPFQGDKEQLALSIGLSVHELHEELPVVYGSTGAWTLLVPIRKLESFTRMKPNNAMFSEFLTSNPKASIHPFCLETYDPNAFMHARHFSSPFSGTIEDSVTGTASGVMGAYYLHYMEPTLPKADFVVEQGQEMGRDGRVKVEVERTESSTIDVSITGHAVFVQEMIIAY